MLEVTVFGSLQGRSSFSGCNSANNDRGVSARK